MGETMTEWITQADTIIRNGYFVLLELEAQIQRRNQVVVNVLYTGRSREKYLPAST